MAHFTYDRSGSISETSIMVHLEAVKRLKAAGDMDGALLMLDVRDKLGNTLLHHTIHHPDSERDCTPLTRDLLEFGADVNAKDNYGNTPIVNAARVHNLPVGELLIDHGADLGPLDDYCNDNRNDGSPHTAKVREYLTHFKEYKLSGQRREQLADLVADVRGSGLASPEQALARRSSSRRM